MRPALKPGLLPVWRNRDTVQVGIDPRRAIALTGMREARGLLGLLDGSRDRAQILDAASALGIGPDVADRVIALLAAGGALHDVPVQAYGTLPPGARARLAPELATAALAHGDTDGGARILARRQEACVRVHGMGRAGLCLAGILSAAGVGQVTSTSGAGAGGCPAGPPGPGGPGRDQDRRDQDRRRGPGQPGRDRRTQPRARPSQRQRPRRPDFVVLADHHQRETPAALMRERIPHLAASASEAIGVVGPLVLPGESACLRCLDLTRAERDPAWPLILAQMTTLAADPPACDAVLATAVAAQAAAQVLNFIDRAAATPAVINGTLELVLPGWQWRRRTWEPHPRCGCGRRRAS